MPSLLIPVLFLEQGREIDGECICNLTSVDSGVPGHIELAHFFFQAEDGIRDVERSRGLGDVYKRQVRETQQAR